MNTSASLDWRHKLFQRPLLLSLAIFFAALLLRAAAIERYITPDELIWVYRTLNFREALRAGDWAQTLQAGHPGVTTMWLGSLGLSLQLLFHPADQEVYQWLTKLAWLTPDNMVAFQNLSKFLTSGRLVVAAINSLGIVAIFWMARSLLTDLFALLVTSFLLLDPFLAGLSGLLHVDGLATTFATISLLSLALALEVKNQGKAQRSHFLYTGLSGAAAALAVLSKSPSLLLVPVAGLMFLSTLFRNGERPFASRVKDLLFLGLAWLGSFAAVLFLLFPALWGSPMQVLQTMSSNANRHVEEALRPTFFLGQVAFDHGPLFYPTALLWRIGPLVTVGLVVFVVLLIKPKGRAQLPKILTLVLILWAIVFIAGLTIAAKKFDRYALPVVPALAILAATGWAVWLRPATRAKGFLLTALLLVQVVYWIVVFPYPLSAYNVLVGGPYSAQFVLPISWGESISRSGSWLSSNFDVVSKSALSGIAPSLAPFFEGETLLAEDDRLEAADYVIFTANSRQDDPQGVAKQTNGLHLLKTIRYGGLEQAWIYENPQPMRDEVTLNALAQPVSFGSEMKLSGQGIDFDGDRVLFTVRWEGHGSRDRYLVKLKLGDSNGHKWSSLETPLLNEVYFFPENWQPDESPIVTYKLEVPEAIPPGNYNLELSLVDEATGSALPVSGVDGDFQGVSYQASELMLPGKNSAVDVEELDMSAVADAAWGNGALRLLGYGQLPERVISGGEVNLDLFWQASDTLPEGAQVLLQIGGAAPVTLPLSRFDSGLWQAGMVVQEKYRLHVADTVDPGKADVAVRPVLLGNSDEDGPDFILGQVEIQAADRLFSLPEELAIPLTAAFERGIHLRGAEVDETTVAPGDELNLVLYWQAEGPTEVPLTAFVHLLDDQGQIISQADRWPGGLPSNTWAPDQVIIDQYTMQIPADIRPMDYQIGTGLYTADNGQRLAVGDASGNAFAERMVLLPLKITVER